MAYNEELDSRIAEIVSDWGAIRKKMFGGTCYLLKGNMMCGVYKTNGRDVHSPKRKRRLRRSGNRANCISLCVALMSYWTR